VVRLSADEEPEVVLGDDEDGGLQPHQNINAAMTGIHGRRLVVRILMTVFSFVYS